MTTTMLLLTSTNELKHWTKTAKKLGNGSVPIRRNPNPNPNPNFGESGFGESGRHLGNKYSRYVNAVISITNIYELDF